MVNRVSCLECGKLTATPRRGLCGSCYQMNRANKTLSDFDLKNLKDKNIVCSICGEEKEHLAKGLCKKCYMRDYHRKWHKKNYVYKGGFFAFDQG